MTYLLILLKAGESLVESRHEVDCVVGEALEIFIDTVCKTGSKNDHQVVVVC